MSIQQLSNRIVRLERLVPRQEEGHYTLEEICQSMWRQNKWHFMQISKNSSFQLFVHQFEREDAEAALGRRHR
jgi:hypothetical protein